MLRDMGPCIASGEFWQITVMPQIGDPCKAPSDCLASCIASDACVG